jgi:hypothetical protein
MCLGDSYAHYHLIHIDPKPPKPYSLGGKNDTSCVSFLPLEGVFSILLTCY